MDVHDFKVSKKLEKGSEIVAIVAVLIGTALFISELFFHFDYWMHELIASFEVVLFLIFFFEIVIHLINAPKKRKYLKKNWFYILTITPFMRIFSVLGLGTSAKAVHLLAHSNKFAEGAKEIKEIKLLNILNKNKVPVARETGVVLYHLNKCKFDKVPKNMHVAYVNTYISPHADENVTRGILIELKEYCKKHFKIFIVFRKRNFVETFRIEQEISHEDTGFIPATKYIDKLLEKPRDNWNVVITDEKVMDRFLQVYGRFDFISGKGFGIFSTNTLHRPHTYEHINLDFFKGLRGHTIAKHILENFRLGQQKVITPTQVDINSYLRFLRTLA